MDAKGILSTLLLASSFAAAAPALAELPPLIPRDVLFGNPERATPRSRPTASGWPGSRPTRRTCSRSGSRRSARTTTRSSPPTRSGASASTSGPRTARRCSTCRTATATRTSTSTASTSTSGNVRDFTPFQGVQAQDHGHRPRLPRRDPGRRSTCATSALLRRLPARPEHRRADARHREPGRRRRLGRPTPSSRCAPRRSITPDGGTEIRVRDDGKSAVADAGSRPAPDEILGFLDFTADGKSAYLISSLGSDTARRRRARHRATGEETVIASSDEVDAGNVLIHPKTHVVQAVSFAPGRADVEGRSIPSVKARLRRHRQAARRRLRGRQPRPRPTRPGWSPSPPTAAPSATTPGTARPKKGTFLFVAPAEARGAAARRDEAGRRSRRATA